MNLIALRMSLARWKGLLRYRRARYKFYRDKSKRPQAERERLVAKWRKHAEEADRMVRRRQKQIEARVSESIRPGKGWQGTQGVVESLVRIGNQGLDVKSAKRDNKNPYSLERSDHHIANKDAYANDISNGDRPTPEMDEAAFLIMRAIGFKRYRKGTPINTTDGVTWIHTRKGTYRVQVIYRGKGKEYGGDHTNHIHVGVKRESLLRRRTGRRFAVPGDDNPVDSETTASEDLKLDTAQPRDGDAQLVGGGGFGETEGPDIEGDIGATNDAAVDTDRSPRDEL